MNEDLKYLQGEWSVAALEVEGRAIGRAALVGACISLAGDRFATTGMGAIYSGRIELDSEKSPKMLTMHFDSGPEAGAVNRGIYEIASGGWRLCLCATGGAAPVAFETAAGSGHALETLVRAGVEAVGPEAVVDESGREAVQELQGVWAMVSSVRGGEAIPEGFAKSGRRTVDGVKTALRFKDYVFMEGLLSKDAGGVKLEHTAGEGKGGVQLGIFELEGDGLRTCFGMAGG